MCCTQLTSVQRDLCEWHSVVGGGGTAIDAAGLDACRAWCDAEASCFAIQWVPGESWCNPCTGWANDQGVDSLGAWAATSGDAEVQSKECWQSGHDHDDGDEDDCTPGWHSMNCLDGTVMYGEGCTSCGDCAMYDYTAATGGLITCKLHGPDGSYSYSYSYSYQGDMATYLYDLSLIHI